MPDRELDHEPLLFPNDSLNNCLDNPIWHALATLQGKLGHSHSLAARFDPEIAPLAGMEEPSSAAFASLAQLLPPNEVAALFLEAPPELPSHFTAVHSDEMYQMVWDSLQDSLPDSPIPLVPSGTVRRLDAADVPQMLALTALTQPGPFRTRTLELGSYIGIDEASKLIAMAGERLHLPGFTEVSAVCTDPAAQGRGLSTLLLKHAIETIRQRGETPFLHVRTSNASAIRLYLRMGFRIRRSLHLSVVEYRPDPV